MPAPAHARSQWHGAKTHVTVPLTPRLPAKEAQLRVSLSHVHPERGSWASRHSQPGRPEAWQESRMPQGDLQEAQRSPEPLLSRSGCCRHPSLLKALQGQGIVAAAGSDISSLIAARLTCFAKDVLFPGDARGFVTGASTSPEPQGLGGCMFGPSDVPAPSPSADQAGQLRATLQPAPRWLQVVGQEQDSVPGDLCQLHGD